MAHLHLPDGVLPLYLWAAGYAVVAAVLVLLWLKFRRARNLVVFARAGFFAALMVVAMSFHVAPLGYHLNLAALAGALAPSPGPTSPNTTWQHTKKNIPYENKEEEDVWFASYSL